MSDVVGIAQHGTPPRAGPGQLHVDQYEAMTFESDQNGGIS